MNIVIRNAAININGEYLLENINMDINDNSKIGIVGPNGTGKSTLLKSILEPSMFVNGLGEEKFSISNTDKFKIGVIEQVQVNLENTLLDTLNEPFKNLIKIENDLTKLLNNFTAENSEKYSQLSNTYKLLGGYNYKKNIELMIKKFGFSDDDKSKQVKYFSGGEQVKIALMKLLLSEPDLLILDEPTNNLDIDTVEWLEDYLSHYNKAIIVVSHDRMFLNKIVNTIYEISDKKLIKYSGNYDFYEKNRVERYNKQLRDYETQTREVERLTQIYEKFRNKPSKASMALSKLKQAEKINVLDKPASLDKKTIKVNINNYEESSKIVIKMEDLSIGYDKEMFLINTEIKKGEHVAIIGPNGIGKSTLLKTIAGKLQPLSGNISYGLHVSPQYFDQLLTFNSNDFTILEEFKSNNKSMDEEEIRTYLGSFLFQNDDVYKKISVLSGGEKVRLKLAILFSFKPNLLILDEVTNHIDIKTKEYLEEIFSMYEGTLIFVSHDRYFTEKIANRLIVLSKNGIDITEEKYDEYLKKMNEEVAVETKKQEIPKKEKSTKNTYEIKKEINRLENEIAKLEVKISELTNETFNPEVYNDYKKLQEVNDKIEEKRNELKEKNDKWEDLFESIQ